MMRMMRRVPFIGRQEGPTMVSMSPSPQRSSLISRLTARPGLRGVVRYKRTPAERMLLAWVLAWLLMASVATAVMMSLLLEVNRYPVVDKEIRKRLDLHHRLTEEKFSSGDEVSHRIIKEVSTERIKDNLMKLAAGRVNQDQLRATVKKYLASHGMDAISTDTYSVLMSLPDKAHKNKVELYKDGQLILTATNQEVPAPGAHMAKSAAYYAYAAAGDMKETPVYVNYGRQVDYLSLSGNGVPIHGKICIARLGKISTADKVKFAEKAGAAGLLLFLDPQDVGPQKAGEAPFPDTWWVGGSALHRGTVAYVAGDPQTPGYASTDGIYRVPIADADLPKIPCQPIGYDDARAIFTEMASRKCPDEWKPKLEVPCNVEAMPNVKVRVVVHNKLTVGKVHNIIATINGSTEPDRLVIVGNHMDSLSRSSAADPLLGISQLIEVARTLGLLHRAGWKPRRTLVFALWDGEEQGMLGSTEWVEDHMAILRMRAVVYIATEMLTGDLFRPRASPSVAASIRRAAALVPHYKQNNLSLLDVWSSDSGVSHNTKKQPLPMSVIGLTDDAPFAFSAGVPTAYLLFAHRYNTSNVYPAYHTGYDTVEMVEKFLDPGFHASNMLAQLTATLARLWADRKVLPFELRELAYQLKGGVEDFARRHQKAMSKHKLNLRSVEQAVDKFAAMADRFMNWTKRIDPINPIMVRIANDMMMKIEKFFISPGGLPTRGITHRNLVLSPEGVLFPGMDDTIKKRPFDREEFGLQTALLSEAIFQAAQHLVVSPV